MKKLKYLIYKYQYFLIFTLSLIFYLILTYLIQGRIFFTTRWQYFNLLIEALLNGRLVLSVLPGQEIWDLSFYAGQYYMYWGPTPILFILPFYLFLGLRQVSDVFYNICAGAVNVLLIFLLLKEVKAYFKLKVNNSYLTVFVLTFALASPNFLLSIYGSVWWTSQLISIMYILIFLICFFRYLSTSDCKTLILAVIFYNLAWIGRPTLFLYGLLFIYPLSLYWLNKNWRGLKKLILTTGLITLSFLGLWALYNYLRFNDFLNSGFFYASNDFYNYNQELIAQKNINPAIFSINNLPLNIYYYFLKLPNLNLNPVGLSFHPDGTSVFIVYPITILAFTLFYKSIKIKTHNLNRKIFVTLTSITFIATMLLVLTFFWSGYVQFGKRYFFDLFPLIFIFLLYNYRKISLELLWLLLGCGVIINILGCFWFYHNNFGFN